MKKIIYIVSVFCVVLACKEQDLDDTRFLNAVPAASDLKLTYTISKDNKGTTVFTPEAKGVVSYVINFGDGAKKSPEIKPGNTATHDYAEGSYNVVLNARNAIGKTTSKKFKLDVIYKAPQNVKVVASSDNTVAKKVNVLVTADFAASYAVYFGEVGKDTPVKADIGKQVSYTYQKAGDYKIKVVVRGGAKATTEVTKSVKAIELDQPLLEAPTPPSRGAAEHISIYSDAYTNIAGVNTFPDWGQAGQGSNWGTYKLGANGMLKYGKLSYQGIEMPTTDVSGMSHLHLDIWTAKAGVTIKIFLINEDPKTEHFIEKQLQAGKWTAVDIPLSDYAAKGLPLKKIFQFKFEEKARPWAKNDVFIDNIYFYSNNSPKVVAPTPPSRDAAKHISIYSDAYTDIAGVNTFPDWGQGGQGSNWGTFKIGADNTLKYGKLSYQGIEMPPTDVSGMSHLHLDIWTAKAGVTIKIFLINENPKTEHFVEKQLQTGAWTRVDIPLSDYTAKGLPLKKIFQFKFEEKARPWAKNDVYIDNIYFYKN